LHDNAHPHTASYTVKTFEKLDFKVLEHTISISPLPTPTYFEPFKDALRDSRFATDKEVVA